MDNTGNFLKFLKDSLQVKVYMQISEGANSGTDNPEKGRGWLIIDKEHLEAYYEEHKELVHRMESLEK